MDEMYYDFAKSIKSKLLNELNGRVVYEVYKEIDAIIFKIFFKDFDYSFAVNNVWDRIYSGAPAETVVTDFIAGYKKAIRRAFFKTEEHKKRNEAARIGVVNE